MINLRNRYRYRLRNQILTEQQPCFCDRPVFLSYLSCHSRINGFQVPDFSITITRINGYTIDSLDNIGKSAARYSVETH